MGSIYYPKYRNAAGEVVEQGVLWLKYRDALGVVRRQSSGTSNEAEARRQLKRLEGAAVEGKVIAPRADKVTVRELTGAERDRVYAEQARRYPGFADYERQTAGIRTIPVLELTRA